MSGSTQYTVGYQHHPISILWIDKYQHKDEYHLVFDYKMTVASFKGDKIVEVDDIKDTFVENLKLVDNKIVFMNFKNHTKEYIEDIKRCCEERKKRLIDLGFDFYLESLCRFFVYPLSTRIRERIRGNKWFFSLIRVRLQIKDVDEGTYAEFIINYK